MLYRKISIDFAKVWPSVARTNLFAASQLKLHHYDSDSSECDENILEITELHKSISSASLESFTLVGSQSSSKMNFLLNAPSTSATSLIGIKENVINVNEVPTQSAHETDDSNNNDNDDVDTLGIGFTRRQIKKRLKNLVNNAFKNFRGDAEVSVGIKYSWRISFPRNNAKYFFN